MEEGATFFGGLVVLGFVDVVAGAGACLAEVVAAAFVDDVVGAGAGDDEVFGLTLDVAACKAITVFAAADEEEDVAGR